MRRFKKYSLLLLILVVFWGLFLRLWRVGDQSLWIDEGFTLNGALSIVERGLPILDSGRLYGNGLLSTYMTAATISVLPFDPFSPGVARIPTVLFGTALIIIVYFFYKNFFADRVGAVAAAFLVAFSYWEIAWSRQVRGYAMASLFIISALFCLCAYLHDRGRGRGRLWIALLLLGAACVSQASAVTFVPVFAVIFIYDYLTRGHGTDRNKITIFLSLILGVSILCVLFGQYTGQFVGESVSFYMRHAPDYLLLFFYGSLAALIFGVLSIKRDDRVVTLLVSIFVPIAILVSFSSSLQLRYFFILFPVMIVATVYTSIELTRSAFPGVRPIGQSMVGVGIILFLSFPYLHFVPTATYHLEPGSPQFDFESAFKIIKERKASDEIVISGYPQLHKVYLGEKGVWLKMNLNEGPQGADKKIKDGVEFYVGAPYIENLADLGQYIDKKGGYIVVDAMTKSRLPDLFPFLENHPAVKRVGTFKRALVGDVYLYHF